MDAKVTWTEFRAAVAARLSNGATQHARQLATTVGDVGYEGKPICGRNSLHTQFETIAEWLEEDCFAGNENWEACAEWFLVVDWAINCHAGLCPAEVAQDLRACFDE